MALLAWGDILPLSLTRPAAAIAQSSNRCPMPYRYRYVPMILALLPDFSILRTPNIIRHTSVAEHRNMGAAIGSSQVSFWK